MWDCTYAQSYKLVVNVIVAVLDVTGDEVVANVVVVAEDEVALFTLSELDVVLL